MVPLAEAQECISRYRDFVTEHNIPNALYAFLTIHQDIIDAMEPKDKMPEMTYGKFRVYLGLGHTPTGHLYPEWRTFVIAVDPEGVDVPYRDPETGDLFVYDFNTPCPATCEISSPLWWENCPPLTSK